MTLSGQMGSGQAVGAGYRVALTARSLDKLERLAAELGPEHALPLKVEVTRWEELERPVTGMGDSIRKEVSGQGVRVTLVEPGGVDTDFWRNGKPDASFLHEDDVARAVMYALAQPEHVAINELLIRPTQEV